MAQTIRWGRCGGQVVALAATLQAAQSTAVNPIGKIKRAGGSQHGSHCLTGSVTVIEIIKMVQYLPTNRDMLSLRMNSGTWEGGHCQHDRCIVFPTFYKAWRPT